MNSSEPASVFGGCATLGSERDAFDDAAGHPHRCQTPDMGKGRLSRWLQVSNSRRSAKAHGKFPYRCTFPANLSRASRFYWRAHLAHSLCDGSVVFVSSFVSVSFSTMSHACHANVAWCGRHASHKCLSALTRRGVACMKLFATGPPFDLNSR